MIEVAGHPPLGLRRPRPRLDRRRPLRRLLGARPEALGPRGRHRDGARGRRHRHRRRRRRQGAHERRRPRRQQRHHQSACCRCWPTRRPARLGVSPVRTSFAPALSPAFTLIGRGLPQHSPRLSRKSDVDFSESDRATCRRISARCVPQLRTLPPVGGLDCRRLSALARPSSFARRPFRRRMQNPPAPATASTAIATASARSRRPTRWSDGAATC